MHAWTQDEDARLLSLRQSGLDWPAISRELSVSPKACASRAWRLRGADPSARPLAPGQRRCHDCGRPTSDYRCCACQARWRRRHGVSDGQRDGEGL